ncbi:O-antigen ligase family protein [Jeotgalibaca arthritidis]|uniref:O-antigen ligase family protein n=1 Tax=Jeotgalibaca arthritidis TaxID=1868794 RepID=A0A6G7KB05_9LACT|nr:O-antigen ligase family protein [Jeotgalibaca arthritidis]QII82449.1 O-antigen ligase family protein [Jeotgalibaca arthritidis]
MIKYLLYVIVTVTLFPFQGHLLILAGLSSILIGIFILKAVKGTITINQSDYHNNRYSILFMLVLLIYSLISIIWSEDLNGWLNYNIYIYIATCVMVVINYIFKSSEDFYELFNYVGLLTIIHNIIGWVNVTTGKYIFSTSPLIPDFKERGNPLSLFNNTNDFATFLVFSIFICFAIMMVEKNKKIKLLYLFTIMSSIFLIYKTMSRANYLALALGIATYILFISNRKKVWLMVIGSTLLFIVSIYVIPSVSFTVNHVLLNKFFNSGDEIRINLIKNAFVFLRDSNGLGIGAGNIAYYLENHSIYNTNNINSVHNWWLDILVNYGYVIFIFYIIFYGNLIWKLNKIRLQSYTNPFIKYTSVSLISILVSYIMGSTSSSSNFPIIWIWVFFGIVVSYLNILSVDKISYKPTIEQKLLIVFTNKEAINWKH